MSTREEPDDAGLPVTLPSGAEFKVLVPLEVEYVEQRVALYTAEFKWENASDLQDVDRMLIMELMVYRWGLYISRGVDYWNEGVDEQSLRRSINDYSGELRQVKKALGMDKSSREKERGDDSVPAYLEKLRIRAKEFGINRENMLNKGIELSQQIIALYDLWANTDEQERAEQRCRPEDILEWIGSTFRPEFQAVDEHFRSTQQRFWVSEQ